jgi:hypothetical protein
VQDPACECAWPSGSDSILVQARQI